MHSPVNLWNVGDSEGLSEEALLLYRSNLLGSDRSITNFGGGNTSAKILTPDPLSGAPESVLWVKGSGGDLGSMGPGGFATLYLDRVLALEANYPGREHEDRMVDALAHCTFNLNPRAPSIDTPLHAFLPFPHVDHMHPDAVIAIAASARSRELTAEVFEGELEWLPWQRPGFDLALKLRAAAQARPGLRGLVLAGHGLFTWGGSSRECYDTTIEMIGRAARFIARHSRPAPFGAIVQAPLEESPRRSVAAWIMPQLRAAVGSDGSHYVGHFSDCRAVLEFVGSERLQELAALGTSCPDHFLRTKILPLVLDPSEEGFKERLQASLDAYRNQYRAYYEAHRRGDSPAMRDPNPVVFLLPGIGMVTFAANKATARLASEFYLNAIHVMRGASGIDRYVGLDEAEAFAVEYWPLEQAKLERLPPARPLAGRVALVTGAASGIGRAAAERLLAEGACVMLTDIDERALKATHAELQQAWTADVVRRCGMDVTSEHAIGQAFASTAREYGGLDILVASAGIASAAPVEQTTVEQWQRNFAVLSTGYFLVARAAFTMLKGLGGSMVFVGSKNALAPSPNAAAYCAAKASTLHLARCLAMEGGAHGIRVNTVNPDAVLRGSAIWSGTWRQERAAAYGIDQEELEDYYASRSLLGREVTVEDVANAIFFFASDQSGKSTGNVLNVDAGNAAAFPR